MPLYVLSLHNGLMERGFLSAGQLVCHCLLIETEDGLVLNDTGLGPQDIARKNALHLGFKSLVRPMLNMEETAIYQVERLGFARKDVRHIVLTHLDFDHAGGLQDFPEAKVHIFDDEYEAAMHPQTSLEKG